MIYDIVCPLCMERYPANNVLFRHNVLNLTANGQDMEAFRAVDPYLQAYNTKHGIEKRQPPRPKVVDPAYVPEQDRRYSPEGLLTGVHSAAGYVLEDRICPYCHNKLYTNAGRMPMQQMSIIGYTRSGKTTFEAAMIFQLTKDGIGCINNTLNEYGQVDEVVKQNIEILMHGDPARPETQQVSSSESWTATQGYHGPYIFALAQGADVPPVSLAFYDLPGEHFRAAPDMVARNASYIGTAQTCLVLIDLENISSISFVMNSVLTKFGAKMKQNNVNVALVLYKVDQIGASINGLNTVPAPLDLRGHKPIDLKRVDADSDAILKFIVSKDYNLQGAYNSVSSELGKDNVRFFTAQAFDSSGRFMPRGCDVPLLWSFARQGLYPHT